MMRRMFLGKIHRARITHADLHYEGSVTIDRDLMEAAGMLEHEEVHVWSVEYQSVFYLAMYANRWFDIANSGEGLILELDYCGKGGALDELKALTSDNPLIRCHGHCDKTQLLSILEDSHCIVVPTTTSFVEGFNQVVVESVLAGRPVVTSDVCPAMEYVMPAVVECEPDNIESYAEGIERLYRDQTFYQSKQDACASLQAKFYDESNSWGHVLQMIIREEK